MSQQAQAVDRNAIMSQPGSRGVPSSEATQVEQSRAIAQVQGALVVAQKHPRDTMRAMDRVREACAIPSLADRAFFKFPRGGQTVTGPTIHLATELARCWGNVDFGISELRRDDFKGESEMLAMAWDIETNTRVTNSFIVPHRRDKKGGPEALIDMRDIYENNANNAARRLRECIFRILPTFVIEEAKDLCRQTLEKGGGVPMHERVEKLLEAFAGLGVTRNQIEKKVGMAADRMTAVDIANLRIIYGSLKRGEITLADEFPPDQADAITADLKASAAKASDVTAGMSDEHRAAAEAQAPLETGDDDLFGTAPAIDLPVGDDGEADYVGWATLTKKAIKAAPESDGWCNAFEAANVGVLGELSAAEPKLHAEVTKALAAKRPKD